jgi:hypothetical protein
MKYEIKINGSWAEVTSYIFRSWSGKRRIDGVDAIGPVYYLGSKKVATRADIEARGASGPRGGGDGRGEARGVGGGQEGIGDSEGRIGVL